MLPEIREPDAPPQIARIYSDIKTSAGVAQVNLIFRYLATRDGLLEWVWPALRPLFRSKELAHAAGELMDTVSRTGPSPLAGVVEGEDLADLEAVLRSYNGGNPQNLLVVSAYLRALELRSADTRQTSVKLTPRTIEETGPTKPFPALPKRNAITPGSMEIVEKMTARHTGTDGYLGAKTTSSRPAAGDTGQALVETSEEEGS